jgi:hypothetical protein
LRHCRRCEAKNGVLSEDELLDEDVVIMDSSEEDVLVDTYIDSSYKPCCFKRERGTTVYIIYLGVVHLLRFCSINLLRCFLYVYLISVKSHLTFTAIKKYLSST